MHLSPDFVQLFPMRLLKISYQFVLFSVPLACFLSACQSKTEELKTIESPENQRLAPQVEFPVFQKINGELLDDTSAKNWKVLHFWATWCKPCLAEFPELKEALPRLENDSTEILIASDESLEQIQKFQEKHQTGLELLRLETGDISDFGIYALPTTIVLDPEGREVFRKVGQVDWSVVSSIPQLIASKP
ncbi:TlpA family protein disulfide reductase [Algoriphagus litoralis]|uniref:TlpA family protein disulfide reductase n=1 Tax=Algoriphagus litoralis TaxID=2202829 RepID=UPI000DBA0667|nr:TlpA disulfide reductase family protein [Algoriphagus litoralis]